MKRLVWVVLACSLAIGSAQGDENHRRTVRSLTNAPAPEERGSKEEVYQADLTVDTLHYEADRTPNGWTIPEVDGFDDDSLWVRFNPPAGFGRFGIWGAAIPLADIPPEIGGPIGNPSLSVSVYESVNGLPSSPIDHVTIEHQALRFGSVDEHPYNIVDLRELKIGFNDEVPFHLVVSRGTECDSTDTLVIFMDEGRPQTDRSGIMDGAEHIWIKMRDIPGIERGYNLAIRAIIADSILGVFSLDPFTGHVEPFTLELGAAYPNPFNSSAKISFGVPVGTPYSAALYDPIGRKRIELASGIGNGQGFISLDARDLSAGIYFVRLTTPYAIQSQKVMLVR